MINNRDVHLCTLIFAFQDTEMTFLPGIKVRGCAAVCVEFHTDAGHNYCCQTVGNFTSYNYLPIIISLEIPGL